MTKKSRRALPESCVVMKNVRVCVCSLATGVPFHELTLECKFDGGDDNEDTKEDTKEEEEAGKDGTSGGSGKGILARDLYLVGASWDEQRKMVSDHDNQLGISNIRHVRLRTGIIRNMIVLRSSSLNTCIFRLFIFK